MILFGETLSMLNCLDSWTTDKKKALDYITAGDATFTLVSTKKKVAYTYRIRRHKGVEHKDKYACYLLVDDNDKFCDSEFCYLMLYNKKRNNIIPYINKDEYKLPKQMLIAFIRILTDFYEYWPYTCKLFISDKCARCGRALTDDISKTRGYGSTCYKHIEGGKECNKIVKKDK